MSLTLTPKLFANYLRHAALKRDYAKEILVPMAREIQVEARKRLDNPRPKRKKSTVALGASTGRMAASILSPFAITPKSWTRVIVKC
ncbi:MAG: hypothetical protein ABIH03_13485, partial [Pseudomonadota bacterium]